MILLKNILMESMSEPTITSSNIFNFYYLWSTSLTDPQSVQTDYGKFIQDEYLKSLKSKYITVFKKLVIEQLLKYYNRKRIDPDFDVSKVKVTNSASELLELMKKTFRSDMARRNDVWIQTCEFLNNLENSSSTKEIYLYIDRLNSMIHNTGGNILGKISYDLTRTYDLVHRAKSLGEYEKFVDKDIRQLKNQSGGGY